jgi:hypothetical protein
MDKKTIVISLLLGIAANAVFAALVRIISVPEYVRWGLTTVLLLILPFVTVYYLQLTKYGLVRVWEARAAKFSLSQQLLSSSKSLCFLGVSARTIMQPQVEAAIRQKLLTNHEYSIKLLLFDRNETEKLRRRALEETGDPDTAEEWAKSMTATIQMVLRIKKSLGKAGERLHIKTYRSFPVFRILIVDDNRVMVNFYATGRFPSQSPCLEVRNPSNPNSFAYCLYKHFDELWREADTVQEEMNSRTAAPTDTV